jgi:hypothetical protein
VNKQPHLQRKADEAYRKYEMNKIPKAYKGGNPQTRRLIVITLFLVVFWTTAIIWSIL